MGPLVSFIQKKEVDINYLLSSLLKLKETHIKYLLLSQACNIYYSFPFFIKYIFVSTVFISEIFKGESVALVSETK